MQNGTRMKYEHTEHTLAIGDIYFTLQPTHFMFEPVEHFEYHGKNYVFAPDCVFVHGKKVYVAEVQCTPLSEKQWKAKYSIYNSFFIEAFKKAKFQAWSDKVILPQFVAVSSQGNVTGLDVTGRELKVISNITEL